MGPPLFFWKSREAQHPSPPGLLKFLKFLPDLNLEKIHKVTIMPAYIWPIKQALLIRRGFRASLLLLLIVGQAAFTFANDTGDVSRISVHQVKALLGQPDTVIIDVRKHRNWWRSSKKIPSAVREDPSTVEKWIPKYNPNQSLIFY